MPQKLHKTFRERFVLTLERFFIYSFAVHAIVIAAILFIIPSAKTKKAGKEFYTDLVSPKELLPKKPRILPAPKVRQSPPSRQKVAAPALAIRGGKSVPGKETSQGVPKSSPGEIRSSNIGSSPSVSKIVPGDISGESKTGPSKGGNIGKPENAEPDLFDKNIIGDLAKRNIEKEEKKVNKDKPITLDTKEYKFWNYNQRLKERIESAWHYPDEAAQKGIYGDLVIKFTIKRNGQLGAAEIVRGSGYPILDKAALEALKEASPYWPLPEEWGMQAYTIEGNFIYTLYRSFIR
jgi:protein TonB